MTSLRVPSPLNRAIDDYRPMKVICIGAGMCGIAVGCLFPQKIPNLELTIYEKNTEVGGTWFENHYPGLRPDLTPHTYQYTFASNPNWSRFYPPGAEFEEYLKDVSEKFNVYKHTKFSHKFKSAKWLQDEGQWEVTVLRMEDGTIIKDYADVLIKATGFVNDWRWPDVPGREDFQGIMLHTANWDDNFDPTGKRVAVLGYGSTGVQITPAIQPVVKSLDHYVRGKVWVPPGGGTAPQELAERGAEKNFDHSEEERRYFYENPAAYLQYRKKIEQACNAVQSVTFKGSEALKMFTQMLDANMQATLKSKPELYEILKPDYPPGCRRIIMGQAWLECLTKDNATLIPKDIKRFTKTGIEDVDGVSREYDAIICATGFDTNLDNRSTPFIGQDGVTLAEVWDPDPVAYFSVNPPKMPNLFLMFGPNSAPASGSIVHVFEAAAGYIIKCVQKLQREYIKSMVCKPQALKNWIRHVDYQHSTTVLSANCRTWFKRNIPDGRVITSWPGSAMHGYKGWENPRFEDFDYQSWLPEDNNLAFLGNGNVLGELNGTDTTSYMDFTDLSKVLLVENPSFVSPKLHEDRFRNAELNVQCAHPKPELNGDTPNPDGCIDGPPKSDGVAKEGEQPSDVDSGLLQQGQEVTLTEKVLDDEAEAKGNGEVKLLWGLETLLKGELHALEVNM